MTACDVVIVGAGVAGASALHHLVHSCDQNDDTVPLDIHIVDAGPAPGEGTNVDASGSAVLSTGRCSKMMIQVYASSSTEFIAHHGREGARRYLDATRHGLQLQTQLARAMESPRNVEDEDSPLVKELGSFYLAYQADEAALRHEFDLLVSLTSIDNGPSLDGIEWYTQEQLATVPGCSPDFYCGIYFPNDGIIDSSAYAKGLVQQAVSRTDRASVTCHWTTRVVDIATMDATHDSVHKASVTLDTGVVLQCRHVIVATGAFFAPPLSTPMDRLVQPCYSYLVHVPVTVATTTNAMLKSTPPLVSSNFFTWGFTHDWSFVDGAVRTSGEDHYSAYKDAHCHERCQRLLDWTRRIYHQSNDVTNVIDVTALAHQWGMYSETPDHVPLVGCPRTCLDGTTRSPICYLVGCNAWGQAILSYAASLVPGLLGYRATWTEAERHGLALVSVDRFTRFVSD